MSTENREALRSIYRKWSAEKLAYEVNHKAADYQTQAIEVMLSELRERGASEADPPALALPPSYVTPELPPRTSGLFPESLGRVPFFWRSLALWSAFVIILFLPELYAGLLAVTLAVYGFAWLYKPRLVDAGISMKWGLLFFVPGANFIFWFMLFLLETKKQPAQT